jgi:hypothetical protein
MYIDQHFLSAPVLFLLVLRKIIDIGNQGAISTGCPISVAV